jgi:hypothetical protein
VKYRYDSEAREEYRKAIHFYGKAAERFFDAVESAIERIRAYVSVAISGCPRKQHPALQTVLYPLRAWLESNIEVVAKDSNAVVLERLPLELDCPDLPSLCYQLMDEFRDNRVYSTDVLNLKFRYKQAA